MEALIQLLQTLISKVPFLSESEKESAVNHLRTFAESVGQSDAVPPPAADQPTPEPPPVVDPGPVAEPVPAEEQTPPPVSPEVAGATPEATNAFTEAAPDAPGPA